MQRIEWWIAGVVLAAHTGVVVALWQQPAATPEPVVMQAVLLSAAVPANTPVAATTPAVKQPLTAKPPIKAKQPMKPKPQPRHHRHDKPKPTVTAPAVASVTPAAPSSAASSSAAAPTAPDTPSSTVGSYQAPTADAQGLQNAAPTYPPTSRKKREQGVVWFEVHVGANGELLELKLKTSSGFRRLDDAAERAVKQWRFQPAQRAGQAVDAWYDLPVRFSLTDVATT